MLKWQPCWHHKGNVSDGNTFLFQYQLVLLVSRIYKQFIVPKFLGTSVVPFVMSLVVVSHDNYEPNIEPKNTGRVIKVTCVIIALPLI